MDSKTFFQMRSKLIKKALRCLGYLLVKVEGQSMLPQFKNNELIWIGFPYKKLIIRNNIILYKNSGNVLVLHRIINVINLKVIVKGDNEDFEDEISFPDILGVYIPSVEIKQDKRINNTFSLRIDSAILELHIVNSVIKRINYRGKNVDN